MLKKLFENSPTSARISEVFQQPLDSSDNVTAPHSLCEFTSSMLTLSEKLAWLTDTLGVLSSLPELSANEVDYQVYENLDADLRSALCTDNLHELAAAEHISPAIVAEIESIRDMAIRLIDYRIPSAQISKHGEWQHVVSRAKDSLTSITN